MASSSERKTTSSSGEQSASPLRPDGRSNERYAFLARDTAGDADQFEMARKRSPVRTTVVDLAIRTTVVDPATDAYVIGTRMNAYADSEIIQRWSRYERIDAKAVSDTFAYMCYKFSRGIFVKIENGHVVNFLPFRDAHYRNEYVGRLRADPQRFADPRAFAEYAASLTASIAPPRVEPSPLLSADEWTSRNGVFDARAPTPDDDAETISVARDFFDTLCAERAMPDMELFYNTLDVPILKRDATEPFDNIYNTNAQPLVSHAHDKYAPILSSCGLATTDADVIVPTLTDWADARLQSDGVRLTPRASLGSQIKVVTPQIGHRPLDLGFTNAERAADRWMRAWNVKRRTCVWCGAVTGAGTRPQTNQRLNLLRVVEELKAATRSASSPDRPSGPQGPQRRSRSGLSGEADMFEIGITEWDTSVRKYAADAYIATIERASYPTTPPLSLQLQTDEFKYILSLTDDAELARKLATASVVLLTPSRRLAWYRPLLMPWTHYVPVRGDLTDLVERVHWCAAHDDECRAIIARANEFCARHINKEAMLDYAQKALVDVAAMVGAYEYAPVGVMDVLRDAREADAERRRALRAQTRDIEPYAFPLPAGPRSIGRLEAMAACVASKSAFVDFSALTPPLVTGGIRVETLLVVTNGFAVIRATPMTPTARRRLDYAAFVGAACINALLASVPNFAYVYGRLDEDDLDRSEAERPSSGALYAERVEGPTLREWLLSGAYAFDDYALMLAQLYLALAVAQTRAGFVHYDLTADRVVVERLHDYEWFHYNVAPGREHRRIRARNIPIIVVYDRARCIARDARRGTLDHYALDPFGATRSFDVLTLLFSTLKIVEHRLSDDERGRLARIIRDVAGFASPPNAVERYGARGGAGALLRDKMSENAGTEDARSTRATPLVIVDALALAFPAAFGVQAYVTRATGSGFIDRMDAGNALQTRQRMLVGDERRALLRTIVRINTYQPAMSDNEYMQRFVTAQYTRRTRWLDGEVERTGDERVQKKWTRVRNVFFDQQPMVRTRTMPAVRLPTAIAEYERARRSITLDIDARDMWNAWTDARDYPALFALLGDWRLVDERVRSETFDVDAFTFFGAVAANNMLAAMRAAMSH
jgi:hypothetical protein